MCMIEDAEPCQVSRSSIVRARKPHTCEECGRQIAVGDRYLYAFMVCDGDAFGCAACAHCQVAQSWLIENCRGFCWGSVREDIEEHIREYPDLAFGLNRLRAGMKRKWAAFRSDGLLPVPRLPASIASLIATP